MNFLCCSQPESRAISSTSGSVSACHCCEAVKKALCCCCPEEHSHHREDGSSDCLNPITTLFSCCGSSAASESKGISNTSIHSKQGEQLATWRLQELNKIKRASTHEPIELGPFIQKTQSRIDEFEAKSYDPHDPDEKKRLQARKKQLDYLNHMVSSRGWAIVGVLGFHSKATSKNVPNHLSVSEVDSVIVKIGTKLVLISLYSNVENYERHHTKLTKKEFENCYLLPILPLLLDDMAPEHIDQISKHGVLYLDEASVPVFSRQIAAAKRSIHSDESLPTDHNTSDTDQCFLIYNDNGNDQFWMTLDANKDLKNAQLFSGGRGTQIPSG